LTVEVTKFLLVDANVLIDFVKSDLSVLGIASRHIGEVYVLSTVLDEVEGLDETDCERFGLRVIEPELAQLMAAARRKGALSTQDHLCLILARERGWVCVTNDGALRKACQSEGVQVLWGLELMLEIVKLGKLSAREAMDVAILIQRANPFHITEAIVAKFAEKLRDLSPAAGRQ
jgi:rRNA-processing protein FCF1